MNFNDLKPIKLSVLKKDMDANQHHIHDWELNWFLLGQLIYDNQDTIAEVRAGIAEDWLNTNGLIWDQRIGYHRYPNSRYNYEDSFFWGYSSWGTPAILVTFLNERTKAYELYCNGNDYTFHYLGGKK